MKHIKHRSGRVTERGQVLPMMGVILMATMGLTGMVTDIGNYFSQNRVQQNAAESAANAATSYWASKLATATDTDVFCTAQLYASSSKYRSLVPAKCPAYAGSIPDNGGQGISVYYVDFAGNQLGQAGSLGAVTPGSVYPAASGVMVTTDATSGAFFSRLFSQTGFSVRDNAVSRIGVAGSVTTITPITVPVPGSTPQSGVVVFPAAFQLNTYVTSPHYSPLDPPDHGQIQQFQINLPCDASGAFCWSGLQCLQSNSNADVKSWLEGVDPCASQPSVLATATSPLCSSNPPAANVSCGVSTDPGVRAADYGLVTSNWAGNVAIVPIISGVAGSNPIVQFAWMFINGANGTDNPKYISGYFLDPAQMPPLPAGLTGPCVPGSGAPCGVTGT